MTATSNTTRAVAVIDYGSGNLRSAEKALARAARESGAEHQVVVTADPDAVARAERIVLPGVGAFGDCMRGLAGIPGMVAALEDAVVKRGRPFLGICVGMQLLATVGREHGDHAGLGWIAGEVVHLNTPHPPAKRRVALSPDATAGTFPLKGGREEEKEFPSPLEGEGGERASASRVGGDAQPLKIPHMGWNEVRALRAHPLLDGMGEGAETYFVHSYEFRTSDAAHTLAVTDYGGPIAAVVGRDNIAGTQFHPEKSQAVGLALLARFLRWRP